MQSCGSTLTHRRKTISQQDEKTRALQNVYASTSAQEASEIYDGWAQEYEEHMRGAGYAHPAMVAAMLARHLPAGSEPLLDAGSGTGVLGAILVALGYPNISGLDASKGMLAHAAAKDIYRDLSHAYLGQPLSYPKDHFAACVASGVFTQGHAPLDGLDELIRITRPGGVVAFSISRTYLGEKFESKAQSLTDAGKWQHLDASGHYDSAPLSEDVLLSQVFAFVVL